MEHLVIEQTGSTLLVDFDPESGQLAMSGESYPENALLFFTPVVEWLREYLQAKGKGQSVRMDMDIVYFNSSSSKVLMDLFDILDQAGARGVDVSVRWRHHAENEIAQECGEEFAEDLEHVDFCLLPYEDAR